MSLREAIGVRPVRGHRRDRAAARGRPGRDRPARRTGCAAGWTRPTSPTTRARTCGCPAWPAACWPPGPACEPVMQLTCRDRNRIALQSDLISAATLGIPNVLLLTGDHPRFGHDPEAKPVYDLDCVQLVWTARTMRDEGGLLSGRSVDPAPGFLIGAVENPFAPPVRVPARPGWARRSPPGPSSARPSSCSTCPRSRRFMAEVVDRGLARALRGAGRGRADPLAARAGVHPDQRARHPRARPVRRAGCAGSRPTGWPPRA